MVQAGPGRVQVAGRPASRGVARDFEEHLLLGVARWDFRGTPRADDVVAAGADPVLVAHTYGGNDTLEGGDRNDVLVGGAGPRHRPGQPRSRRVPGGGAPDLRALSGRRRAAWNCVTSSGLAAVASATASCSGTSTTVTDCRPPAVVATSEVSPTRRCHQVERRFQPITWSAARTSRARVRLPERATTYPSTRS